MLLTVLLMLGCVAGENLHCEDGIDNVVFIKDCGGENAAISVEDGTLGLLFYDQREQPSCTVDETGKKVGLLQAPGYATFYGHAGKWTFKQNSPKSMFGVELAASGGRIKTPGISIFQNFCTNGTCLFPELNQYCGALWCSKEIMLSFECDKLDKLGRPVTFNMDSLFTWSLNRKVKIPKLPTDIAFFAQDLSGEWSGTVYARKNHITYGCVTTQFKLKVCN